MLTGTIHYISKTFVPLPAQDLYNTKFIGLYFKEAEGCLSNGGELDEGLVELAAEFCRRSHNSCGVIGNDNDDERLRWVEYEIDEKRRGIFQVSVAFSDVARRIWEAGLKMFDAIEDVNSGMLQNIRGKTVLEIGAGVIGLSAFALKEVGVRKGVLTDKEEQVDLLRKNMIRNGFQVGDSESGSQFSVAALDVEKLDSSVDGLLCKVDTLIAADVTYDYSIMKGVLQVFHLALNDSSRHRVAYLFATKRSQTTHDQLLDELNSSTHQFCVTDLTSQIQKTPSKFDYLRPALHQDFSNVCVYRVTGSTERKEEDSSSK